MQYTKGFYWGMRRIWKGRTLKKGKIGHPLPTKDYLSDIDDVITKYNDRKKSNNLLIHWFHWYWRCHDCKITLLKEDLIIHLKNVVLSNYVQPLENWELRITFKWLFLLSDPGIWLPDITPCFQQINSRWPIAIFISARL